MMLTLSPLQKFPIESGLVLLPLYSGWSLKLMGNSGTPEFHFMKNTPQSFKLTYQLKPKSSFTYYTNQGYTNLKVRGSVEIPQNDPSWLSVGSDWFPVANYTSNNQNSYRDLDVMVSPPLALSIGNHNGKVKFHIEGEKNGVVEVLSTYEIPVLLKVFDEGYFYDPSSFTFYYQIGSTNTQPLQVGGTNWTVDTPEGLVLTGSGVTQNPDGSYTASASGLKTFQIGLSPDIHLLLGENESITIPVIISYDTAGYTIPVTIIQAGSYYPQQTTFAIQNGSVDALFKLIHLTRTDAFTVEAPANIGYELLDTPSGKKIKVYVIDPESFGSGVYNLYLKIIYPDATFNALLIVTAGNQFDLGLGFDTVFTHSMKDLDFSSSNVNSYINLVLNVVGTTEGFTYQFPFFKGSAKKHIGRALKNLVTNKTFFTFSVAPGVIKDPTISSNFSSTYPLRYFNVSVQEKIKDVVVLSYNKTNIPFVVGYQPVIIDNKGILQHNNVSRFTPKSFALISVFSQVGNFSYKILKNNESVYSTNKGFGYIATLQLDFEEYNAQPGDVFDFVLEVGTEEIKKTFIIYPQSLESFDIMYQDSFGLESNLNFTGISKTVSTELSNKLEVFEKKNFLHTRKFNEKEKSTLKLNTGFLLKSQALEIAELMRSPVAWVVVDGKKVLEIIPKTEKIEEYSNDRFLLSYEIEFEINKTDYAQDYNF